MIKWLVMSIAIKFDTSYSIFLFWKQIMSVEYLLTVCKCAYLYVCVCVHYCTLKFSKEICQAWHVYLFSKFEKKGTSKKNISTKMKLGKQLKCF